MSLVSFLALNAGAMAVAFLAATAAVGRGRPGRLIFATLCGVLIVLHSAVLAAGLVGWLTVGGLATFVAITLAGTAWWVRGAKRDQEAPDDGPGFTTARLVSPLVAVITSAVWTWPHIAGATRLWIWDDYTYHMVYPALWLRDRAIAAVTPADAFTMQAWYPLSASIVSTWFMVPFAESRADALAWVSLTALLYGGIVASGAAELLARLGCRRGAWAVPVVLFASSHRIGVMASSFSDADLAHAAALFAALVFATPRGDAESSADVRADVGYGALLTGIAVGVKVSAAPTALIILLMMAGRAGAPGTRLRVGTRMVLVFAGALAVTGGYWYARNVIHTGNPVYPAAFLFWPGATFPHTTLREYAQHYGFARMLSDALVVYANWPHVHAALAVVGLVGLAGWLVTHRRVATRAQSYFVRGALAITGIMLLLLPTTPYSAGNGMTFVSGFIHWDSMRYVALLPVLGWVALGFLIDAGAAVSRGRTLAAGMVTVGALLTSGLTLTAALLILAAAIVGAALITRIPRRVPGRWTTRALGAAAALALAGVVAWSHGAKAAATGAAFYREPLFGAAIAVLDRQPAGTRVAVFGDQWVYPTFGARHHLVPVRLSSDGTLESEPVGDAMTPGPLTVHPWRFRSNLAASQVRIVVVIHLPHPGRSPGWPAQAAALESIGGVRLLYRDGAVGIWKLNE